jgi:chemotaxis protein CheY-P-specific phosphatase CheC
MAGTEELTMAVGAALTEVQPEIASVGMGNVAVGLSTTVGRDVSVACPVEQAARIGRMNTHRIMNLLRMMIPFFSQAEIASGCFARALPSQ